MTILRLVAPKCLFVHGDAAHRNGSTLAFGQSTRDHVGVGEEAEDSLLRGHETPRYA